MTSSNTSGRHARQGTPVRPPMPFFRIDPGNALVLTVADTARYSRQWLMGKPRRRCLLVSTAVGVSLLLLTVGLWHASLIILNLPVEQTAILHAQLGIERLTSKLNDHAVSLRQIGQFYILSDTASSALGVAGRTLSEREFQQFCESVVNLTPGFLAVLLTDPSGIPIWIAPEHSPLSRQDIYWMISSPGFVASTFLAGRNDETLFSDPIDIPLHGRGLMAACPVVVGRRHVGYIVGILAYQDLLFDIIDPRLAEQYRTTIHHAGVPVYAGGGLGPDRDSAFFSSNGARMVADASTLIGNQFWEVMVAPMSAIFAPALNLVSMTIVGLGVCLAIVLSYLAYRWQWRALCMQTEARDQRSRLERTGLSLLEVKSQLDLILNSIDEGIVLYDGQLQPVQANATFLTMFQLTEDGRTMADGRLHHQHMARIFGRESRYWSLFETLQHNPMHIFSDEIETPPAAGQKVRAVHAFRRRAIAVGPDGNAPQGVLVIYKDVTTIRDIERVKDEFLSSVSHELRSPLASIKGFVETIRRDPEMASPTREEFISIICEETDRLQSLVEDLLDLRRLQSRGMALRLVPYDMRLLVEDVARGARALTQPKNITLEVQWDGPEDARLQGDVAQMGRALRNLVVNAVKYSPPGGTIVLRGHSGPHRIWVEVCDQGAGIDENDLPYIFDQFYRGASQGYQKGTGLGLALVKHTLELHGGQLGVRSDVGHGTIFRLELPREFAPPDGAPTASVTVPASSEG